MTQKLSGGTIKIATVLQAFTDLAEAGKDWVETGDVRDVLLPPTNYDVGNRIHYLMRKSLIESEKIEGSGRNQYRIKQAGRDFLREKVYEVQQYGEYELVGKDRPPAGPTGAANQALAELNAIIERNTEAKQFLANLYYQIEEFLEEHADA